MAEKPHTDPLRLLDAADTPPELVALLHNARETLPPTEKLARVWAGLVPLIEGGTFPQTDADLTQGQLDAGQLATSAGSTQLGAKAGLLSKLIAPMLIGSSVATGVYWHQKSRKPDPPTHRMESQELNPLTPVPNLPDPPPLPPPPAPTQEKVRRLEPVRPAVAEEVRLLESARNALTKNPARALAQVREHERRFPLGVLNQEREVIAIDALRRLGNHQDAQRRMEAFERRYPGSAHNSTLTNSE